MAYAHADIASHSEQMRSQAISEAHHLDTFPTYRFVLLAADQNKIQISFQEVTGTNNTIKYSNTRLSWAIGGPTAECP